MLWTSNKSLKYHIIKLGEDLLHTSMQQLLHIGLGGSKK